MSGVGLGGGSWIGSAGAGGVTNAANIGTGGVGPFHSLSAGVLQFKNVAAGSAKVAVTEDVINKEVLVDAVESEIDVRNLKNSAPGFNASFAAWADDGKLASVPGWSFDDTGAALVGAQNSLTIPPATTDYMSLGISPTIANPGLTTVSGVQLNSPMNATVAQYNGFQVFGYGTAAPTNFTGYLSQPNHSGTGGNAYHFIASGGLNVSGQNVGLQVNHGADANDLKGVEILFSGDASNTLGFSFTPTGTYTNAGGLTIDLSGATIANRPTGISCTGGSIQVSSSFETISGFPTLVDSGNLIRPVFTVQPGAAISGTDVLLTNLAGFMDFKDDHVGSPLGLGVASVGFVSQISADTGVTASKISMLTAGLAVDAASGGGSIVDAHLMRGITFNFGGSLNIGTLYGLRIDDGISGLATTAFGISVDDAGAENYLAKSLKIDGGTKVVSDASIGLEIGGLKSLRLAVMTTAQRNALPNIAGTMIFDSTTGKGYLNDGAGWHQFG